MMRTSGQTPGLTLHCIAFKQLFSMSLYFFVFVFVFVLIFEKLWPDNQLKVAFSLTMMTIIVTMIVMITMIVTMIRMRIQEPDYGLNLAPCVM